MPTAERARRSRPELGLVGEVHREIESDLDNLMGPVFEDCCRTWAGSRAVTKRLGEVDEIGSWMIRDGRIEIDDDPMEVAANVTSRRMWRRQLCREFVMGAAGLEPATSRV